MHLALSANDKLVSRSRLPAEWRTASASRPKTSSSGAGDMIYIPADCPHLPLNTGNEPAVAVIARTDPHEQESVVLLPELEALVPT